MSKELEALKDLRDVKGWNDEELNKRLDIIETALEEKEEQEQVLRIIEEKGLSTNELHFIKKGKSWEEYIKIMKEIYFDDVCAVKTKEEYDLLKRYLWKN